MSLYFPGSDSSTQNFSKRYPGAAMKTNVLVWHSTEGVSWPGYNGGATAPNATVLLSIKERRMYVRSHFAWNRSSRALENRSGGVETNTLNSFQVEIIGTCDPRFRYKWGTMVAGVDYFYIPDMPQWALELLAKIPAWLHEQSPAFPIKDGALRGWLPYPSSYGNENGQRLSFTEWNNTYGMVGHQHVPENSHGDPGNLNIKAIMAAATGVVVPPAPPVVVPPVIIDPLDPKNYFVGAKGDYITTYGKRIELWSAALGLRPPYKFGPGPSFTQTDRLATQAIQVALGYDKNSKGVRDAKQLLPGGDADGLPGPVTLAMLFSAPPTKPVTPKPPVGQDVRIATWNMKSPTLLGSWPIWTKRRQGQVDLIASMRPDVFLAQEVGSPSNEAWYNPKLEALGLVNAKCHMTDAKGNKTGKWRAIWYNPDMFERVTSGLYTIGPRQGKDTKEMAECILRFKSTGELFYFGSFHLENQKGYDQLRVDQIADCNRRKNEACRTHGVKPEHAFIGGDANSETWVADWVKSNTDMVDSALLALKMESAVLGGLRVKDIDIASINRWLSPRRGTRQDYIFVDENCDVLSFDQRDGHRWSDHHPTLIVVRV